MKMPLLPELLNEPAHVVIQSAPTDWEAVRYSARANGIGALAGAAIAALAGAILSYFSSRRVLVKKDRRDRLEKIYIDLYEYRRDLMDLLQGLNFVVEKKDFKSSFPTRLHQLGIGSRNRGHTLAALLHISLPEFDDDTNRFLTVGARFNGQLDEVTTALSSGNDCLAGQLADKACNDLNEMLSILCGIQTELANRLRRNC